MKIEESRIGFIGLGGMGERMARRLIERGFHVIVFDRTQKRMDPLLALGAAAADSLRTLAVSSDVIISCVTDDGAVMGIYAGTWGVLASARRGTIVIDMSTVLPATSRSLAELGRERGIEVLDVPISGSTPAAEAGTVILFGGGDREVFERCDPIFKALSREHYYLGPNGAGNEMKLVVNTLLGVGMQAIAEATALGEQIGLDRYRMLEVLAKTAVIAPAHQGKLPRAARADYSPQFPLKLMRKDFGLILDLAGEERVPMPATMAASIANRSCEESDLDFSYVMEEMRRRANGEAINPAW
jgi:3-hydroxyisobutyrate dehydrogenase-like beta-hydroxyacid dehydrogenase